MPIFLDCEASSLTEVSYPVEIGWGSDLKSIKSCLINPSLYPESYTDWNEKSEKIHGLSRQFLRENGESPESVACQLNDSLNGEVVYSDSNFDKFWCDRMFYAAKIKREFEIKDIKELLINYLPEDYWHPSSLSSALNYRKLCDKARKSCGLVAHRAGNDVAYLIELYRLCKETSGYW